MADSYSIWAYTAIVPKVRIESIHNLTDDEGSTIDPATMGMSTDFPRD